MVMQIAYALLIGDLIMMLANQCRPYECVPGATDKAIDICMSAVTLRGFTSRPHHPLRRSQAPVPVCAAGFRQDQAGQIAKRQMVGIVGEIYVKFSPLGNNQSGSVSCCPRAASLSSPA